MKLYLFDENEIILFCLPIENVGNFWMTDYNKQNIVNVRAVDGTWYLSGNEICKITNEAGETENIVLNAKKYYTIEKDEKKYILFCDYSDDLSFNPYKVNENDKLIVGKGSACDISLDNPYLLDTHLSICFSANKWQITKNDDSVYYLNGEKIIENTKQFNNGDIINIYGFKLFTVSGILFVNNPFNNLKVSNKLLSVELLVNDQISEEEIINKDIYGENDYFLISPRLRKIIETYETAIDSPPAKEAIADIPLWVTLAPMLTMAATSMISLTNILSSVADGTKTFKQAIPSLVISICMLMTILVWPFLTKKFEKKRKIKKEEERQAKYLNYINKKRDSIYREFEAQKKTLQDSLLATNVCYDIIMNKRRVLWERKLDQGDFLTIRLGIGQVPFKADIRFHTEEFSMDDDNLKRECESLVNSYKELDNVPIGYSFADNKLTAVAGMKEKYLPLVNNILLQMMAFHSYSELKIVVFTSEKNKKSWEYLKDAPYCFSNEKSIRFFATNENEMQEVSDYLTKIFDNRKNLFTSGNGEERITSYAGFNSYFLLLIDNIDEARNIDIVEDILDENNNLGFGMIIVEERLSKLPSEVNNVITVGEKTSIITRNDNNSQIRFTNEIINDFDMQGCVDVLSNLPLFIDNEEKQLPSSVSFLEMFSVGNVEQLNVLNRWKENDPTKSLKTEIGFNENNSLFMLDLHEKYHGPHGLIAGMTGSGKSEFVISYILSMAINYSPEEVAFVLIDYKGGGLSGAFVNSETGKVLPHVVGTVTNLDKTEINRALASIKSELTRRQAKFNEVRDKTGENTIDIYKYQRLYRDGIVDEPIPHLIIVSDEFAELKEQQPEFMDDLVSTARIGRSLGVHLILATQKPSGVVDAQIWSNAKFKVCLKVQDKADSMEMLKCDLAAELKNVGRFYLQVGYNEYFAIGQAAWAGAKYYPNNEFKKPVDKNLYMINNVGNINKSINNSIAKKRVVAKGEELSSVLNYIIDIASNKNLKIRQLWKEKLSDYIILDELIKKYNFEFKNYNIEAVIGEYDDPANQKQGLLTLPITDNGNALIYGMSESGKDELLQTITYNIISNHSSDEVNLFLLDFGSETLVNFADAPQVGDVVLGSDEEKLTNLVKLLNTELMKRKKLFIKYNGNYKDYLRLSGEKMPNIIVVINSIEVINELYFEFVDKFLPVIREGAKYGINFIITTENQNSIKLKISQCCKQVLCLQLTNEATYKDILGRTEGLIPSNNLGRGLVKIEKVCEFQTAFIDKNDDIITKEKEIIDYLNSKQISKAMQIPVMPEIVDLPKFAHKYVGMQNVPIGIANETLVPTVYDFKKKNTTIISSNEMDNMKRFITNFINVLDSNDTFTKLVVDASNFFDTFDYKLSYINKDFNKVVDALNQANVKIQEMLTTNNMNIKSLDILPDIMCVIIGFDKFYSKLTDEEKKLFMEILLKNKETLKISCVFIDVPSSFKKYEYEEWYKNNLNPNDGIWIGQGLTQQFTLKSLVQSTSYSNIEISHGVILKSGMPTIVKLLNDKK